MKEYLVFAALVLTGTQALAQSTPPTTALPAIIQSDRAAVMQQAAALKTAVGQLQSDERAGNSSALGADHTQIQIDRIQLRIAFGQLRSDAQSLLQPESTSLLAAVTKMHSDQVAGNSGALQADEAAVQSAEGQLKTTREAVFAGLQGGFRHGHRADSFFGK